MIFFLGGGAELLCFGLFCVFFKSGITLKNSFAKRPPTSFIFLFLHYLYSPLTCFQDLRIERAEDACWHKEQLQTEREEEQTGLEGSERSRKPLEQAEVMEKELNVHVW